jgi:hypothetical protein
LKDKSAVLVIDYDSPVRNDKVLRSSVVGTTPSSTGSILNITNAQDNVNLGAADDGIILYQVLFNNADKAFAHATPRQLVFIDPSSASGAQVS